jgi:hypothetical protein
MVKRKKVLTAKEKVSGYIKISFSSFGLFSHQGRSINKNFKIIEHT